MERRVGSEWENVNLTFPMQIATNHGKSPSIWTSPLCYPVTPFVGRFLPSFPGNSNSFAFLLFLTEEAQLAATQRPQATSASHRLYADGN